MSLFNIRSRSLVSHIALTIVLLSAPPALAETILTGKDGSFNVRGELLSFDDGVYLIKTDLGELNVRSEFVECSGKGCAGVETPDVTTTDEVLVRSDDGQINIKGKLVEFTDTEFTIDTASGQLKVRREFASCEGAACPDTRIKSDLFTVSVAGINAANLVTTLVGDYAESKDYSLTQQLSTDDALQTLLVGDERGLEISRISMQKMDTPAAIQALFEGKSQFAITRERVTAESLSAQLGSTVTEVSELLSEEIIGLDAVSFVVSEANGIDVINLDVAALVLNGQVTNWAQLGGADQPINLHILSDSVDILQHLQARGMADANSLSQAKIHSTPDALNAAISADPSSFGVMFRSQASGVKALNLASSCNIFVDNSDFAIQTEEHPLALRWYQYTKIDGITSDFARNIGQFIQTDFGQQSIASRGLVTQQLQIVPMQEQGPRLLTTVLSGEGDRTSNTVMRSYFSEASNARRISTSLRFLSGNAVLDSKAESDIERISAVVRSSEYEGYEVLVFGFSDSYGTLGPNLALSERRAESVKQVLLRKNPGYLDTNTVKTFGVGPIAPVGCNDLVEGREQNRRVEVWIRPRV